MTTIKITDSRPHFIIPSVETFQKCLKQFKGQYEEDKIHSKVHGNMKGKHATNS